MKKIEILKSIIRNAKPDTRNLLPETQNAKPQSLFILKLFPLIKTMIIIFQ
jgi:hypothetical protein